MKILLVSIFFLLCVLNVAKAEPLPKPWYQSNLESYESGTKESLDNYDIVGYLKSINDKASSGAVLQHISPLEEWLGQRVKLTARIKTEELLDYAVMFMSIHHGYGYTSSDNMSDRQIKDSNDWQEYSIVLDIPQQRNANILFGVRLAGNGVVYFDDFKFEVVDSSVEVTGFTKELPVKKGPGNLSFSKKVK